MKTSFIIVFLIYLTGLGLAGALADEVSDEVQPPTINYKDLFKEDGNNSEYLPRIKVNPPYPKKAIEKGAQGGALVEYTVDANGNTKDIVLIAEIPEGYGFGEALIKAAERYKYKPRKINGKPVEVTGVRTSTYFSINGDPPPIVVQYLAAFSEPDLNNPEGNFFGLEADGKTFNSEKYLPVYTPLFEYPKKARKEEIYGKVKLQFTVKSDGTVANIVILEESPKGYGFGKTAKKVVEGSFYLPLQIDGKPAEINEVIREVEFCGPPIEAEGYGSKLLYQPKTCPHS